jgi:GNAT superfamily N-acetyltransferase
VPRTAAPAAIRVATLDDLDVVVELRLALLREHARNPLYAWLRPDAPERARTLFATQLAAKHETTFLAMRDGRAVGILRCVESGGSPLLDPSRYCYVSSVYVLPEVRRRGVLRALMARAEQWCRERGFTEMRLHSTPESLAAGAAWEALGFGVVEQLRLRRLE